MAQSDKRRGVAPLVGKAGISVAAVLGVFGLDLVFGASFWPATLYVLAIFAASWFRSRALLVGSAGLAVLGVATAGILNRNHVPSDAAAAEWAGRIAIAAVIAVIVTIRVIRDDGVAAQESPMPAYPRAADMARELSDRAALHIAETNAATDALSPAARVALNIVADEYAVQLERRLDRLLEVLPIFVWTAKPTGEVDFFNHVALDYMGVAAPTLLRDGWLNFIHPDDYDVVATAWQDSVVSLAPYENEFRFRSANGEYRWFHHSARAELDPDGQVMRWWGTSVDVNDARTLETDARKLAADRAHIIESVGDGISEIDRDWNTVFLSERAAELVGGKVEDIVGRNIWEVYPEMRGTVMEETYYAAVETGEPQSFTTFNPVLGKWFSVNATPTERGLTVAFRDVTQTRTLEANLEQAQRLESIGELTGGIAHDFNNLLTVVLGGAEALAESEALTDADRHMLALVLEASRQGAELTSSLLAFARQVPLSSRPTDLNGLVETIAPLLDHTLGADIDLRFKLAPDLPAVVVDATQFESAVLNLAINARDAMPNGGALAIDTRRAHIDEDYAARDPALSAGEFVVTSVSDTGSGINPEHVPHLFDPFFSTKALGRGSGLGLAMVWAFTRQSNGHITVYSEPGLGTTFNLYLPITDEAAQAPLDDDVEDVHGTGTILLAEDDELVRDFAASQLRARGYDVIEAGSGIAALTLLDEHGHIDLLFTDVVMPGGMTGKDLAESVSERRPGTPVLYASGYTEDVVLHDGRLGPEVSILPKPYTAKRLAAAVAKLLRDREASQ